MQWAGFTSDDAPRAVLLFFVVRPKMLGIMAGMTQGVPKIGFTGDDVTCFRTQLFLV